MKLQIEKTILENILIHAIPFLEKKDTTQITSHIYLEANNDTLTIKATDYDIGFFVETKNISIKESGITTANGKKLLDIVKILKQGHIELFVQNDTLFISQGNSKFKLPTFDPTTFPTFPTFDDKPSLTINSHQLIDALKKITPSIDMNNPKFELNGALIDIKENSINFVSTDTRRLSVVTLENQNNAELSLIIPKKAIIEIQKLFFDDIEIFYDETYLIIVSSQYKFFTKLINGKFPEYNRIIPKEVKNTLILPKKEIVEALKQITIVSTDVKLTFFENSITFESLSDDNNEAKTTLLFNTPFAEPFTLAVNSRYILDFLNSIITADFILGLNDSNHPFVLQEDNFKTIVMPIVI